MVRLVSASYRSLQTRVHAHEETVLSVYVQLHPFSLLARCSRIGAEVPPRGLDFAAEGISKANRVDSCSLHAGVFKSWSAFT